jgi:Glycosyl hydrolase family 79 C-terminal beta domain
MDGPFRRRYLVADIALLTAIAVVVLVLGLTSSGTSGSLAAGRYRAVVLTSTPGRSLPAGFLGVSLEYPAVETYAGDDPLAINPIFVQLIRELSPGQAPVLRIGGDSADWTWWPVPGVSRPPGVSFAIGPRWIQVTRALTGALHAQLILGLNLAAGSPPLAAGEANALLGGLGSSSVTAFELGNEPELYSDFAWYRTAAGRGVTARPRGYDFTAFTNDFTGFAASLPQVRLAGPAFGDFSWSGRLAQFLAAEPRVRIVTLHRYPLQQCYIHRSSPRYPTIANLLSPTASEGLAKRFAPYATVAHASGLTLRIEELNTVACGAVPAVSRPFASALWALDTLFEMAHAGVDGVNMHTFPGAGYELFSFSRAGGRWHARIAPEFYGLLMFAAAAPPGSRLLAVAGDKIGRGVKVWATAAPDRSIRVVLINKQPRRPAIVSLTVPGAGTVAMLERLVAPGARATAGVTIGGQSYATTGALSGTPHNERIRAAGSKYTVTLRGASAALLTVRAS